MAKKTRPKKSMVKNMKHFVIPSIDLLDGKIVRLYKGDYNQQTIYNISVTKLLERYKDFENLHIVDLNGAKGDGLVNIELIKKIRLEFSGKIQLGGGIRSVEIAEKFLNEIRIDRAVLGTIAITNFNLTKAIIDKFTSDKIVLAIDCKFENHKWTPKANGWQEANNKDLFEILKQYQSLAKYTLVTDIGVDGTMQGSNCKLYKEIKRQFPNFILQASGGVSSVNDIKKLQQIADFAIVGKALYDGIVDDILC